jgi:DNA-binding GntR family transcriptional regulator
MDTIDISSRVSAAEWESAVVFQLFADQPAPTLTVPEQIAAQVGERILDGRLLPGERISEQELADAFQVSRGPVRESLRILEREGLVTLLARRGAIVTELSAQELSELLDIRAGLFEVAVRRLMSRPCPELMPLMVAGTQRLQALAQDPEAAEAYAETTYRLLILVVRLNGNRRLQRMLTTISLQTLRYSKLGLASVARRQRSVRLWEQAIVALQAGDVEALVQLTRLRMDESAQEAVRLISTRKARS